MLTIGELITLVDLMMSKKPEPPQIDSEHNIYSRSLFFMIMCTYGWEILKLFPKLPSQQPEIPKQPSPKKTTNPYLDPEQTHPKYALFMIALMEGIDKHMNLLPYLLRYPAHFNNVKEVRIQYYWDGFSNVTPIIREYRLQLQNGMLVGEGRFSIRILKIKNSSDVSIPQEVVKSFLGVLKTIKIEDKPCRSGIIMTDNYPYVSITLFTETGHTKIASTSQFEGYVPWCAILQGHQYKVDSDIPAQALNILKPYLKRDILDTMIDEFKYS
jgi:hypothetical protein